MLYAITCLRSLALTYFDLSDGSRYGHPGSSHITAKRQVQRGTRGNPWTYVKPHHTASTQGQVPRGGRTNGTGNKRNCQASAAVSQDHMVCCDPAHCRTCAASNDAYLRYPCTMLAAGGLLRGCARGSWPLACSGTCVRLRD